MIAIIADDFTGAAELAGISLRYGLKVSVCLHEVNTTDADVLIICTDSRSLNIEKAKKVTNNVVKNILQLQPSFIYKKIDSVLRGHVIEEIKAQQQQTDLNKVLIVAANPSLGRTINNGEYFINEKRITETGFVSDPEFPIKSAFVKEIVDDSEVEVLKHADALPQQGIVIAEAISSDDIKQWASAIDASWMLVGAGDFYTALLDKNYKSTPQENFQLQSPHLYICGTAFNERKEFIKTLDSVSYLPDVINEEWLNKTCNIIQQHNKLIIAIDESTNTALALRTAMAKAAKEIIARGNVKEIFIEGGSTAAAVLQELNIKTLSPVNELQRGVVRMKANDLFITVKPGSYQLPKEIKDLYS